MNRALIRCLIAAATLAAAASAPGAPLEYRIDPDHTYPSFEADHMGLSFWRGKLNRSAGKVVLDKEAGTGTVDVTMDMNSIDFGLDAMNKAARGKDLFDTARHPKARFQGRLEDFVDGKPTRVVGDLTLHGVTRPVTLEVGRFKCIPHPLNKRELCGADASTVIQRDAFGVDAGKDYGFSMDVQLRIQVEAVAAK